MWPRGESERGSWDVQAPTLSLPTVEWGYWESPGDRKAILFSQWSHLATKGIKMADRLNSPVRHWEVTPEKPAVKAPCDPGRERQKIPGSNLVTHCLAIPWNVEGTLGMAQSQHLSSVQFSSVTQSCLIPCNPMDYSMPGFPAHYQLPEFTQTHVHWVGDAIQPSHPLSSPPVLNLSQHQGLFKWVSTSHQVAKVLAFQLQHQSFQWIFRTDFP